MNNKEQLLITKEDLVILETEILENTKSESTKRAYARDFQTFQDWCENTKVPYLPASPDIVGLFVLYLYRQGKSVSTIERNLVSISQAHKLAGHQTPVDARVREIKKGIVRKIGRARKQAKPLTVDYLKRVLDLIPRDFIGVRDRALILVGWGAALRRSEITALDLEDLEEVADGLILTIRKSKTDQEMRGRKIGLPFIEDDKNYCPVKSLNDWIKLAPIKTGPIFCAIGRHGNGRLWAKHGTRLGNRSVNLIVKRRCVSAGYAPENFSGHSLRAGFATSAAAVGVSDRDIMAVTGHRSIEILNEYIRDGKIFRDHPLRRLF